MTILHDLETHLGGSGVLAGESQVDKTDASEQVNIINSPRHVAYDVISNGAMENGRTIELATIDETERRKGQRNETNNNKTERRRQESTYMEGVAKLEKDIHDVGGMNDTLTTHSGDVTADRQSEGEDDDLVNKGKKEEEKEEEEEEEEPVGHTKQGELQVPDGGWGWLVVLGSFIIMVSSVKSGVCGCDDWNNNYDEG